MKSPTLFYSIHFYTGNRVNQPCTSFLGPSQQHPSKMAANSSSTGSKSSNSGGGKQSGPSAEQVPSPPPQAASPVQSLILLSLGRVRLSYSHQFESRIAKANVSFPSSSWSAL